MDLLNPTSRFKKGDKIVVMFNDNDNYYNFQENLIDEIGTIESNNTIKPIVKFYSEMYEEYFFRCLHQDNLEKID